MRVKEKKEKLKKEQKRGKKRKKEEKREKKRKKEQKRDKISENKHKITSSIESHVDVLRVRRKLEEAFGPVRMSVGHPGVFQVGREQKAAIHSKRNKWQQ